ncbi:hypothetical protein [Saccharospirillum salsuginis]|uniref:Uncharacterized protein n=1 Tax=Saccharospirillum salsuginis TaxID=418750 RepID=A0A918K9U7_9GAMM|nr:hypothetical protein [Saccharospirillum salsuginis]GGX56058.1 hypothetical protein GCM10007392_24810 [Saccharospirillum salsuginis]
MIIEKPDLSFTSDPGWIAEREKLWDQYCESRYSELRGSTLKARRQFFFHGTLDKPREHGLGEKSFLRVNINDFPLRSPEGWDYLVYEYGGYNDREVQELAVYQVLPGLKYLGWSLEEELALWEYFFQATYERSIRSPKLTKRKGVPIEGDLPLVKVISQYSSGLSSLLKGTANASPKCLHKADFLISALSEIDSILLAKDTVLRRKLDALFKRLVKSRDNLPVQYEGDFSAFYSRLSSAISDDQVDPVIKNMWIKWSG